MSLLDATITKIPWLSSWFHTKQSAQIHKQTPHLSIVGSMGMKKVIVMSWLDILQDGESVKEDVAEDVHPMEEV